MERPTMASAGNEGAVPRSGGRPGTLCGADVSCGARPRCGAVAPSGTEGPGCGSDVRYPLRWYEGLLPMPRASHAPFTLAQWDPWRRAQVVIVETHATNWIASVKVPAWRNAQQAWEQETGRTELYELWHKAAFRPAALAEIVQQAADSRTPFFRLLSATPQSHPRTSELIEAALGVAFQAVIWFKARNERARPSQVEPLLYPPLPIPAHSAYPSGHATQSRLMAYVLAVVRPDLDRELRFIAREIAVNREIAGLHYPTDSIAGEDLAKSMFAVMAKGAEFARLVAEAADEWPLVARKARGRSGGGKARRRGKGGKGRKQPA